LGYQVTAIDLSERFVRLTKTRVPGATVRKMDMQFLDFPPASFDGLWASFSLLHIRASDVNQTLSGFKRVLRPGGLFFTAVHRGEQARWVKTTISGMERDTLRSGMDTKRNRRYREVCWIYHSEKSALYQNRWPLPITQHFGPHVSGYQERNGSGIVGHTQTVIH